MAAKRKVCHEVASAGAYAVKEKRRQLSALAALHHLNDTQLAAVLLAVSGIVDDDDIKLSRWRIGRDLQKVAQQFLYTIELPTEKGFRWTLCRLDKLFNHFVKESEAFAAEVRAAIAKHGRVLTLILYADELTPGDVFKPDNLRKSWGIYASLREFGPVLLHREAFWLPLAILRSSVVAKVDCALPCCWRLLLRSLLCGEPLRLGTEGFAVELDSPEIIVLKDVMFLADLDAHRATFAWRGTSSLRPCFKCKNCMKRNHSACTSTSWEIDITCTDDARFDLQTDEGLYEVIDMLKEAAAKKDKKRLTDLEKAWGMNHVPLGLWQDPDLRPFIRPVTGSRVDPMHIMYVGGVFGHELFAFLRKCKKAKKIGFPEVHEFLQADWRCPFLHRKNLAGIRESFSKKREKAANRKQGMKCMASEFLSLYPLLRRFAEAIEAKHPELKAHCQVFYALCDVADVFQEAKMQCYYDKESMANRMKTLISRFLQARQAVCGTGGVKPKYHLLLHVWLQFLEDGLLMDCWVQERMHMLLKQFGIQTMNTGNFERSVIIRSVVERTRALQQMPRGNQLQKALPCPSLSAILPPGGTQVGKLLRTASGRTFHSDDVIFLGGDRAHCFMIAACFGGQTHGLVLERLQLLEEVTPARSKWMRLSPPSVSTLVLDESFFVLPASYWSVDGTTVDVLHSVWWQ